MTIFETVHPVWKTYDNKIRFPAGSPLPADLLTAHNGSVQQSFSKGLLMTVQPEDFQHVLAYWDLPPESCYPFLKFAFGQFIFFHDDYFKVLDPVSNTIEPIGEADDYKYLMNDFLCQEDMLNDIFLKDLYMAVTDTLGAPEQHECYAFVPALGLGGSKSKDNIERRPLDVELNILSKL